MTIISLSTHPPVSNFQLLYPPINSPSTSPITIPSPHQFQSSKSQCPLSALISTSQPRIPALSSESQHLFPDPSPKFQIPAPSSKFKPPVSIFQSKFHSKSFLVSFPSIMLPAPGNYAVVPAGHITGHCQVTSPAE